MSEDVAVIGIKIETTGADRAKRSLDDLVSSGKKAEGAVSGLSGASERAQKSLSSLSTVAAGVVATMGAGELIRLTDQYTKYTAQLKLATGTTVAYANAMNQVRSISTAAQQDISAVGTLYARIANGTRELGISQQRMAALTETVSLSLKVSGAAASESSSAMLQLSQAFASGVLRGEEFNAVNEAAPRLMRALADGIGVPVGALKSMAEQGKITSEVMANALPRALADLREEAKSVQTIGGSFTVLKNNVLEFVGTQAQASGAVRVLTTAIDGLAGNLNLIAAAAGGVAAAKLSETLLGIGAATAKGVGSSIQYAQALTAQRAAAIAVAQADLQSASAKAANLQATQAAIALSREEYSTKLALANATVAQASAQIAAAQAAGAQSFALASVRQGETQLLVAQQARAAALAELAILGQQQVSLSAKVTTALTAQAAAQTALNTATSAGGTAAGLVRGALGLLGGPIGAITTLLGLGATAWMLWGSASKSAQKTATDAVEQSTAEIIANLDKQNAKLRERIELGRQLGLSMTQEPTDAQKRQGQLGAQIEDLKAGRGINGGAPLPEAARVALMQTLLKQYAELESKIQQGKVLAGEDAATKATKDLVEVRMRLLGVNKQYFADLDALQKARESGAISEKAYVELVSQLATATYKSSTAGKEAAKSARESASAAKAEQSTYDRLIASIKTKIDENAQELAFSGRLTESDKLRIKLLAELDAGAKTLTASHKASALALLEKLAAQEKEKASIKSAIALYQEQQAIQSEIAADYVKQSKAREAMRQGVDAANRTLKDQEERMKLEVDLIGQTSAVRDVALAKLEAEIELRKELAAIDSNLDVDEPAREEARIAARERAARKVALAERKVSVSEWEKTSKLIGDTLADFIMGGGRDAASYLKRLFSTLVLRPVVETIVGGALNAVGFGGGSGGSGILGGASNGMSVANLFGSGGTSIGSAYGQFASMFGFGGGTAGAGAGTLALANGVGALGGDSIGTLIAANPSWTGGAGLGAAALPVALAALGWFGSEYFDKGDSYSGAAYATSGGNDPLSSVRQGLTNYDPMTGDLPDREALLASLAGLGAKGDLGGVNDRGLMHLLRLAEAENRMERDGGSIMNWSGWIRDGAQNMADFYRGPGYANPESMGWWDNDPAGGYRGSMDYLLADPKIVQASRVLSEGLLAPLDSISKALGLESDFRVTTGMARNDKTGNIFGGLAIQNNGQDLVNSGKREFDSQGEYLRSTFSDALGAFKELDLPNWAKGQVDAAQAEMAKLSGDDMGKQAAEQYQLAAGSIAGTISQISNLIKIVPELGGASQDAVYNIGQALGGLDQFTSLYAGFVQNFYTESERFKYIRDGINNTLSAVDLGVTAETTRDQFRALVDAQDLTTESGQRAFAALMQVSGAFAEITPVIEEVVSALDQQIQQIAESIGSDFTGVLTDGLLGNLTGADLGGAMADVVIGGVYNALASNVGNQISEMMMSTVVTPLITAAMTGSSIAESVSQAAIANMVANAQAAAQALNAVLSSPEFKDAIGQIDEALKGITGSMPTRPYYTSYQPQKVNEYAAAVKNSADEAAKAAEEIRKAWTSISDSLLDEVRRIRGELADAGDQSMAYWQSQFAIDTAAARSGDEEAAKRLTDISRSLLDSAGREAASMLEMQQMRAWVAQSLQDTSGYAQAIAGGALTNKPGKTPTTFAPLPPVINQAPIVMSADPGVVAELRKANEKLQALEERVRLMSEQQREGLNIDRRREDLGQPVYMVPTP